MRGLEKTYVPKDKEKKTRSPEGVQLGYQGKDCVFFPLSISVGEALWKCIFFVAPQVRLNTRPNTHQLKMMTVIY